MMNRPADHAAAMSSLWMYRTLDRFRRLSYRGKIMIVAFVGTHIPLLGLIAYLVVTTAPDMNYALKMVGVTVLATLVGTGITLFILHLLLRPIVLTSRALHDYIIDRTLPTLPSGFSDTAGTLMADTNYALKRLDETIDHLEHYDAVTALPNRARFVRLLDERIEDADKMPFAVCVLSIERLDDFAATFGQKKFENVLRLCVQQFELTLEHRGALSRVDTRKFALVLETDDPEAISATLVSLDQSLGDLCQERFGVSVDCRSGISLCPLDGRDPQTLLDDATTALDLAVREKARSSFFSNASREVLVERHALERDLGRALDNEGELVLHYQPIVDADGGRIIGAEALIRWQHPTRGMISPGAFIPLAEESDLIKRIGRWTLRTACRQIATWNQQGIGGLQVAVNLSARQFNDPSLLDYVAEILHEFAIEFGTLEVELTETSAMNDAMYTCTIMRKMRELGISIAIDDFGTGYSNMSYLRTMPFNKLKIDREFVQDIASNTDHQAICRALIALAHELNLEVLAEGTETSSEVAMLREQGCSMFQGFYFHKPMPAAEFEALFADEATRPADRRVARETACSDDMPL